MTHDERRLLCLVARMLTVDDGSKAAVEAEKLVMRIQRHASVQETKRRAAEVRR
jgi:hypothetical protein